ncbi:MAG: acyl-CoA thioesterase [Vicinamibacteria bacterium]
MSAASTSSVRVRYAETDQMGVAWHGNFLAWFEVGRTDLLRRTGFSYRELEAQDVKLPVIEAHVRYLRPARYDDLLEIRTRVEAMTGARVSFAYEVYRSGESKPLATATTAHAVIDSSGRARRVPEEIRSLLA